MNKFLEEKFYNFANVNERLRAVYLWCVEFEVKEKKKNDKNKKEDKKKYGSSK